MGSEELWTGTDREGDAIVVSVRGDVDLATSDELRRVLLDALDETPQVIVDLHEMTFIDSSGLTALVDAHRRARDAGGVLTLRNPTPMLRRLLDITKLDSLLVIETRAGGEA